MRQRRNVLLVLVAVLGLVAGCGDDDDSPEASDGGNEFCDGFLALNASDAQPTADQIREVAAMAPDDAKAPMEAIADGFEEQGEAYGDTEEFGPQYAAATSAAAAECADQDLTVTATEYQYEGIPSSVEAGIVGVDFENAGGEFHELVLARKKDGVDKSFEEILQLDEEEASQYVDVSFGTFAPPGSDSAALLDLREPGEYVAICFIPEGAIPGSEEEAGPPHFTLGMQSEITVE